VHWLYYQRFPDKIKSDADELITAWSADGDGDSPGDTKSRNLIHLHVFSDKYGIEELGKETFGCLFYHMQNLAQTLPEMTHVKYIFESLEIKSPLCWLLIHMQCLCHEEEWQSQTSAADWRPDFLMGVLARYAQVVDREHKLIRKHDICDYHVHKTDEDRAACKKEGQKRRR
jgi:hypothetical protein